LKPNEQDQMFASIEGRIAAERGWRDTVRSLPVAWRLLAALVVTVIVPLVVLAVLPRADLGVYPAGRMSLTLALLIAPALLALWLTMRPIFRPRLPHWVAALVVLAGVGFSALVSSLPEAHALYEGSLRGTGDDFLPLAAACLAFGLICGAPVLVAFRLVSQKPWLGPTAYLASALTGVVALQLHCPMVGPAHLLGGHFSVVVVFLAAIGVLALLRRRP